jgi:hypothetical protein
MERRYSAVSAVNSTDCELAQCEWSSHTRACGPDGGYSCDLFRTCYAAVAQTSQTSSLPAVTIKIAFAFGQGTQRGGLAPAAPARPPFWPAGLAPEWLTNARSPARKFAPRSSELRAPARPQCPQGFWPAVFPCPRQRWCISISNQPIKYSVFVLSKARPAALIGWGRGRSRGSAGTSCACRGSKVL